MFGKSVCCLIVHSIHVSIMHAIGIGWLSCHSILVVLYFHYTLISYYRICMFRPIILCYDNSPMDTRFILILYTIARGDGDVILQSKHGA